MLNHPEEPLPKKLYQVSMDSFYRADTFCRKSERNAKLAVKKLQLRRVKKAFGLDYMTLLEQEASPEELDKCMRDGHHKLDLINKEIRALRAEKASLDDMLQRKLAHGAEYAEHTEAEHEHPAAPSAPANKNAPPGGTSSNTGAKSPKDLKDEKEAEPTPANLEAEEGMEFAVPPKVAEASHEEEFVVLAHPRADEQEKCKE